MLDLKSHIKEKPRQTILIDFPFFYNDDEYKFQISDIGIFSQSIIDFLASGTVFKCKTDSKVWKFLFALYMNLNPLNKKR